MQVGTSLNSIRARLVNLTSARCVVRIHQLSYFSHNRLTDFNRSFTSIPYQPQSKRVNHPNNHQNSTNMSNQSTTNGSNSPIESSLFGPIKNMPKELPPINQFLVSTHDTLIKLGPPQSQTSVQSNQSSRANVCLVMGNESCDFDTTISSLTLAYYLSLSKPIETSNDQVVYAPLINVPRRYFRLREELCFALQQEGIDWHNLTFLDDIDLNSLSTNHSLQMVLTDHNRVSPSQAWLSDKVIGTIDHHFDEHLYKEQPINRFVAKTASCSSHVVNIIEKSNPQFWTSSYSLFPLINLLMDCILLDSHNFDMSLDKTTQHDQTAWSTLNSARSSLQFKHLKKLRSNVTGWTSEELLLKDSKLYQVGPYTVMLSTVPLQIDEWQREQPDLVDQLAGLTQHLDAVMVLTSFTFKSSNPPAYRRQILIVVPTVKPTSQEKEVIKDQSPTSVQKSKTHLSDQHRLSPDQLFEQLCRGLEQDTQLRLVQVNEQAKTTNVLVEAKHDVLSRHYEQLNVGASRKQVAPRVEEILSKLSKL